MSILKTIFNRQPAKRGKQYHFEIPKKLIDKGVIDPDTFYEIRVYIFDLDK